MTNPEQISVAFCCLGNICRSPMAQAVFEHTVSESNLSSHFALIDSFGTAAYHTGEEPDHRSVQVCVDNGVPVNHRAQKISVADFDKFDYILAMDRSNLSNLNRIKPKSCKAKVMLFGDFKDDSKYNTIVQDPYYGGVSGFQENFEQLKHFSNVFLKRVVAEGKK